MMRYRLSKDDADVAVLLQRQCGVNIERRCGGNGKCGNCRIDLISGRWLVSGREIDAPCKGILACRSHLVSEFGEVDVPQVLMDFAVCEDVAPRGKPFPLAKEPVIAIDLGSTTVVGALVRDGRIERQMSALNRQAALGADVMSRITYCQKEGESGVRKLRDLAIATLRDILKALDCKKIKRIVVAGNTVMSCLLHGVDPSPIGVYPFNAPRLSFDDVSADSMGFECDAVVSTVPCVSGFIGGDIVSGLLACPLQSGEALLDVGTNCEMVFNANGVLLATSAAAGPAFEGGTGGFTIRAIPGAVSHVGDGAMSVIGDCTPIGLCGSGVIDYLALRKRQGLLKSNGQFADGRKNDDLNGLWIPSDGIQQIQLAKAAVFSGIKMLERKGGIPCRMLYLGGLFGEHLDIANARAIGMLPEVDTVALGNTSLQGTLMLACNPALMELAKELSGRVSTFNLSEQPNYERLFTEGLKL